MSIELAAAELPFAAVNANQHRRLAEAIRQIEIAEQGHTVVLGEHDIGLVATSYSLVIISFPAIETS